MQNLRRNVMRSVKIDKKKLLTIVRENKEKHIAEYNESVEDYKRAAVKAPKTCLLASPTEIGLMKSTKFCHFKISK